MCNLYRITTSHEAMRRLFRVEPGQLDPAGFGEIYPNRVAPIIKTTSDGERYIEIARWGVLPPRGVARPVTNVRNLTSPFWRASLSSAARRCLVPVSAFCEWSVEPDPATGSKCKVWFAMADGEDFAFAGVTRPMPSGEPEGFAFLTCAPNGIVGAVHPKPCR